MSAANPIEIVRQVRVLAAAYPHVQITSETVELFRDSLAGVQPEALSSAVRQHIAISRFFPSVAELRERVERFSPPPVVAPAPVTELMSVEFRDRLTAVIQSRADRYKAEHPEASIFEAVDYGIGGVFMPRAEEVR